jgi:RNA polymerase sigma factor (sigma-70 family)
LFCLGEAVADMKPLSSYRPGAAEAEFEHGRLIDLLYREHRPGLIRYLAARFRRSLDVEDVVQTTFLKLADHHHIEGIADHRSYIFALACNIAIDNQRKSGRQGAIHHELQQVRNTAPVLEHTSEKILLDREELAAIETTLRKMPKLRRRIFLLIRFEGVSVRDVAAAFAMSEAAVYKHVARALSDCALTLERRNQEAEHCG